MRAWMIVSTVCACLAGPAIAQQTQAPAGQPAQAPAAAPAPPPFATTKVDGTDNVYIFRYGGHQSMFVVTPEGVIATDPIAYLRPQAAETYERVWKIDTEDSLCGGGVIQALDVDRAEPWPDGRDRPQDQALPV